MTNNDTTTQFLKLDSIVNDDDTKIDVSQDFNGLSNISSKAPPPTRDPDEHKEDNRLIVFKIFFAFLFFLLICICIIVYNLNVFFISKGDCKDIVSFLEVIKNYFGLIGPLIGFMLGYYFKSSGK